MKTSPSFSRRRRGYTLIEIMLVLGIIAVLMSAAIYFMSGSITGAKLQRVEGDMANIKAQLQMYEINNRMLPTTQQGLMALVKKPDVEPVPRRWIQLFKELPKDPWNHPYLYVYPGKHNPDSYDIYSLGIDGIESDDDMGNW